MNYSVVTMCMSLLSFEQINDDDDDNDNDNEDDDDDDDDCNFIGPFQLCHLNIITTITSPSVLRALLSAQQQLPTSSMFT